MNTSGSLIRCVAVWLAVTMTGLGLLRWLAGDLIHSGWPDGDFAELLGFTAELALSLCVAWFLAVTTAVTAQVAHLGSRAGSGLDPLLCPPRLRRLILAACGIAISSSLVSAPALALTGPTGPGQHTEARHTEARHTENRHTQAVPTLPARSLIGLALPDRATASASPPTASRPQAQLIRVRAGDSLWSLTERMLPPGASDAEIAIGWHKIHRHNRDVLGADPDLILPGTELSIPPLERVVP